MKVLFPPNPINIGKKYEKTVFLAGSIDMGNAEDWQNQLIDMLKDWNGLILNPRRPDWDSSWKQEITHPLFHEQVSWELEGLEKSDLIVYYFAPKSKAPVTMLELGLHARSGKAIVCCPEGFWRKGNIDIVCERYQIPKTDNLAGLVDAILR